MSDTLDLFADEANELVEQADKLFARLASLGDTDTIIDTINEIKKRLHAVSPMRDEPVDCVIWARAEHVHGNEYNPNVVAPPEMRLLELSIREDHYTQPIVGWPDPEADGDVYEVVDGFHRHQVGKTSKAIRERMHGRLPITVINSDRRDLEDRQAATIRHNRARGQHTVEGMSDLVLHLVRAGKSEAWICEHLGLDTDELLRLRQTSGLAEAFADQEFSEAWEADGPFTGSNISEE